MASIRVPLQEQNVNISHPEPEIQTKVSSIKDVKKLSPSTSFPEGCSEHDIPYFRNLLLVERKRLLDLCENWKLLQTGIADVEGMENILGDIRTVIGQAHLIMDERFAQFEGLVDNCEFHTSDKAVTCQDLQGFWDMIYFQVEDVNKKFSDLDKRKDNQWKPLTLDINESKKKSTTKKQKLLLSKKPDKMSAQARREEARKRLAAAKATLKKENRSSKVTFDAVFFKVDSPARMNVKLPRTPHSKESKRPTTPTSANFMHGRYIQRTMSVETPDSKKSLVFQFPNDKTQEVGEKSETEKPIKFETPIDGLAKTKDECFSSSDRTPPNETVLQSVSTMTEPYNLVVMGEAVAKMCEQIQVINKVQGSLCDNDNASLIEEVACLKQQNESFQKELVKFRSEQSTDSPKPVTANSDTYEHHYQRSIEKVKLLEAELSTYRGLKSNLCKSKEKLVVTLEQLSSKWKEIEGFNFHLQQWNKELEERQRQENEELIQIRSLSDKQKNKIDDLEKTKEKFEAFLEKYQNLSSLYDNKSQEYDRISEECQLVRAERNRFETKFVELCKNMDDMQANMSSLQEKRSFEIEEFANEKAFFEEEKGMLHSQLDKTEETLQSTLKVLSKAQEKVKEKQSENESLKAKLEKVQDENAVLQEENDITKANSRLAILEQQEEVINCEVKLKDLVSMMTPFLLEMRKLNADDDEEPQLPILSDHPCKTPSKSLVVSALARHAAQGESREWSPDVKFDRKPIANLLGLVNDVTSVMTLIRKTAMTVQTSHQLEVGQLRSDKKEFETTIQSLKDDMLERERRQQDVVLNLRKRINDLMTERNEFKERLGSVTRT